MLKKAYTKESRRKKYNLNKILLTLILANFLLSCYSSTEQYNKKADNDLIPPTITLNGEPFLELQQYDEYIEKGAIATDNHSDNITVLISSTVNTEKRGTYKVTYTASDLAKNTTTKERIVQVNPLFNFKLVAHRGVTLWGAPENSIDSAKHAVIAGYKYIENDIQYTFDNNFVIMHDTTINRTCIKKDGKKIKDPVKLNSLTLNDLQTQYKLYSTNLNFQKHVPTLAEWLSVVKDLKARPYMEIKSFSIPEFLEDKLISEIRNYFPDEEVTVISFNDNLLQRLSSKTKWRLGYLSGNQANAISALNSQSFVNPNSSQINEAYISSAKLLNLPVSSWTVNTIQEAMRLNKLGLREVTTDKIAPLTSKGKTINLISSDKSYTNHFSDTPFTIKNNQVLILAGGFIESPNLSTSSSGAIYGSIFVNGSAKIELVLNNNVIETITTSGVGFVNIATLIKESGLIKLRITPLSMDITISKLSLRTKKVSI